MDCSSHVSLSKLQLPKCIAGVIGPTGKITRARTSGTSACSIINGNNHQHARSIKTDRVFTSINRARFIQWRSHRTCQIVQTTTRRINGRASPMSCTWSSSARSMSNSTSAPTSRPIVRRQHRYRITGQVNRHTSFTFVRVQCAISTTIQGSRAHLAHRIRRRATRTTNRAGTIASLRAASETLHPCRQSLSHWRNTTRRSCRQVKRWTNGWTPTLSFSRRWTRRLTRVTLRLLNDKRRSRSSTRQW